MSRSDDGFLMPGQVLTEPWSVEFTRRGFGGPRCEARVSWPHPTVYALRGEGDTPEDARIDLVLRLASAIVDVENPEDVRLDTLERLARTSRRALAQARKQRRDDV